ncbi:MAG: hypothetical protein ACOCUU_02085 [Nanoarchaeota archaeon]
MKGFKIKEDKIIINRELTELDMFVKNFLEIIKDYTNYLIVSGFVSISTGRVRGTEDIDMLLPLLDKEKFLELFKELNEKGYWCYQTESEEEAYEYLENLHSLRFAKKNEMFPNMEVIPVTEKRKAKYFELTHPQIIKIQDFEFHIPWIEFEITYKEKVLKGKKDLEDAQHLRSFFSDILKQERFEQSEEAIKDAI